ncbi:MAG: hypothetical protein ACP5SH_04520 [Syntrophobacteraceae bacterium]
MKKQTINKLLFVFALVVVILGGAFINADAACPSGCLLQTGLSTCMGNCPAVTTPSGQATCQGAYSLGPTVPKFMGLVGF